MKMASSGKLLFPRVWKGGILGGQIIFIMRKLEKFGMQSFAAIGFKFLLPAVEFSFKHFPAAARFKALFLLISHSQHLRAHYRIAYKAEYDSLVYRNSNSNSYRNSYCFSAFPFPPAPLSAFPVAAPFPAACSFSFDNDVILYINTGALQTLFTHCCPGTCPVLYLLLSLFFSPTSVTLLCRHCKRIT